MRMSLNIAAVLFVGTTAVYASSVPMAIYNDTTGPVAVWGAHGPVKEVSSGAYEGSKCIQFIRNEKVSDGMHQGCFGLNFTNWSTKPLVDISAMTHMRFAYRNLREKDNTIVYLRSKAGTSAGHLEGGGVMSVVVPLPFSAEWKVLDIPVSAFGDMMDKTQIYEMVMMAYPAKNTAGEAQLWLDDVSFYNESSVAVRTHGMRVFHATCGSAIRAQLTGRVTLDWLTVAGRRVDSDTRNVSAGEIIPLHSRYNGAFVVRIHGAGIYEAISHVGF